MLVNLLEKDHHILYADTPLEWEEAIRLSSKPLLSNGAANQLYIDKMIENVKTIGPYIVISPFIALAHARPEDGALATDLTLLISKKRIHFSEHSEHDVNLLFCFTATDSNNHLLLLSELAHVLSSPETVESLKNTTNEQDTIQVLKNALGGI